MKAHPKHIINKLKQRNLISAFAKRNDLVYFGEIAKNEEVDRPKGLSFNRDAVDRQYCHGNIGGFEISLLSRTVMLGKINKGAKAASLTLVRAYLLESDLPHFISFTNSLNPDLQKLAMLSDSNLHEYQITGVDSRRRFIGQAQSALKFNSNVGPVVELIAALPPDVTVEGFNNQLLLFVDARLTSTDQINDLVSNTLNLAQKLESVIEG